VLVVIDPLAELILLPVDLRLLGSGEPAAIGFAVGAHFMIHPAYGQNGIFPQVNWVIRNSDFERTSRQSYVESIGVNEDGRKTRHGRQRLRVRSPADRREYSEEV
jgi:hypothetical protein